MWSLGYVQVLEKQDSIECSKKENIPLSLLPTYESCDASTVCSPNSESMTASCVEAHFFSGSFSDSVSSNNMPESDHEEKTIKSEQATKSTELEDDFVFIESTHSTETIENKNILKPGLEKNNKLCALNISKFINIH